MMKMAPLSALSVLLFCCAAVVLTDGTCNLYAAVEGEVAVPLNYALKPSDHLRWMRGNSLIFYRRGPKVTEGKMDDIYQNGSLKLTNVNKSNDGTYTSEVYDEDGKKMNSKSFKLCVLDPVVKPTVKFQCDKQMEMVKFTCTVGQQPPGYDFEWTANDKVMDNVKNLTLSNKKAKEVETTHFRCRVFNQVSSMLSDAVQHNCIKPLFPDELFGINIWIIVGGGAGVVVVLIMITIVCCIQNRRKRQMHLRDEEELRLRFTHQNHHHHAHQQPHAHNHHHSHDHQPAGHTGPRQHRSKQPRNQQRPRDHNHSNAQPQPSPRRPAQVSKAADTDDEKPPPLPQPRKKAPKATRA